MTFALTGVPFSFTLTDAVFEYTYGGVVHAVILIQTFTLDGLTASDVGVGDGDGVGLVYGVGVADGFTVGVGVDVGDGTGEGEGDACGPGRA